MNRKFGLTKRFLLIFTTLSILLSVCVNAEEKPPLFDRHIYDSVYLGEPLTREDILNCAYSVANGKTMMYTTLASRPSATFIAYNLTDRKLEFSATLEISSAFHTKTSWSHKIGADGCVYLVPHGYISLFKYDPFKKELTNSGSVLDGLTAAYGVCFDEEGNIYFGGFPLATMYKFNNKLELVKEYGTIFPGESYVMSMGYYNGKIYAGGQDDETTFRSVDVNTGKITEIVPPTEKFGISDRISSYYMMDQVENLLFCTVKVESGMYHLFVFDAEKEEWVFHYRRAYGHYVSPVKDGKVYFIGELEENSSGADSVGLVSFDLETYETKSTGIQYYGNNTGSIWMEVSGYSELPGESLIFFSRTHNSLIALNLETQKTVLLDYALPAVGVTIQDIENGLDNNILMGSYMGDELVSYNPTTGERQVYAATQTEAIKLHGNMAYAGCYTQGVLYEYDLTQAPSDTNPKILTNLSKYHQERIFDLCIIDDNLIAMGTYPNKGYTDGGVAIYDKTTGETVLYNDISPGQSVEALAYKDGILYGCTSIYINATPIPTDEAYVFAFDMEKREVIKKTTVRPSGVSTKLTSMGDLEIGPDGNLWGVASGVIFCLDPETLDIIKYAQADTVYQRRTMSKIASLYWDENGYLYTVCNGYFIILDPETMEFKNTRISMQYFIIGGDGNIYFNHWSSDGSKLSKFAISALKSDELSEVTSAISEALVLKSGSNLASVNGKPEQINADNTDITVKNIDGNIMVPLRFVSESLGATVAWSGLTQTTVVRLGDIALKASVGKNEICINGKKTSANMPLILEQGSSYISLDALCKALNKNLYVSDSGIIVITSEEKTFYADDALLNNITTYVENDIPKLISGNFFNKFI